MVRMLPATTRQRESGDQKMTVSLNITIPDDPTLRLGGRAIDAELLLRVGALMAAAEAMAQLHIEGDPPLMWHAEIDAARALLPELPGMTEIAEMGLHPLGMTVLLADEDPVILIQRGLPSMVERVLIRHELCHVAQARAGRLELYDAGEIGRVWVMPAGSVQLLQSGTTPPLEAEAERFQADARYVAERAALERTAPADQRYSLQRAPDGSYDWQLQARRAP